MREALLAGAGRSPAGFTEIRFHLRIGLILSVQDGEPEAPVVTVQTGGVVRCHSPGGAWGVAGFGEPAEVPDAVARAHALSQALRGPPGPGLVPDVARDGEFTCPAGRDPGAVPENEKRELVLGAVASLHRADRRIVGSRFRYRDAVEETWVVTSEGTCLFEARPAIELSVLAVAEEEGTRERALGSFATAGSWAELEREAGRVEAIAERAVSLLRAVPARPGRQPVVLAPDAAGLLVHRLVGHLCHGDSGTGSTSALAVGTRIGPSTLSIGDDGTVPRLRGTMAFDHEGVPPRNTPLVRSGVIVGHLHTRRSAARHGTAPTGSARGTWRDAPMARMSNTYLAQGQGTLDDLLGDIPLGLYLAHPVAVVLDTGRAALRAGHARMIRGGELAEPVRGAILNGDILSLFGLVDRVAGDFRWDPSAAWCRRGGGGAVAVSTGAPHLRLVDARIGEAG